MAHACDIVAYVGDGCILCLDCGAHLDDGELDSPVSPVFEDGGDLRAGETCGDCGAFVRPDGDWSAARDTAAYREDLDACRWATCAKCNHQEPRWRHDGRARLEARRGELTCPNCHGSMRF